MAAGGFTELGKEDCALPHSCVLSVMGKVDLKMERK